eukprot:CAMPEP_0204850044 /NCGR_PEP_ID=MMETSP1347-20130617/7345_1 /ASSEMBLY_ACC=CAM_ASM_000690 /TAXON_ID=215587 /ORGANISM="Aplanochytrium stocchinoi, Strain GSBS06" /LENGTH=63 /DNA_ID=CAMNT_0051992741 /DNA_START=170 /DNA_END=361 /DNA_ORIENTATION=+
MGKKSVPKAKFKDGGGSLVEVSKVDVTSDVSVFDVSDSMKSGSTRNIRDDCSENTAVNIAYEL